MLKGKQNLDQPVDVLLTHSYHLGYDPKQLRKMRPYAPLGTLYAASVVREKEMSVAVFDTMLQEPITGFDQALRRHRPRIVAIYEDDFNFLSKMCLTRMRALAWSMIQAARSAGARVVVHGSDATDHVEEYLRCGADYALIGEAEVPLADLCSALLRGEQPDNVPGLRHLDTTTGQVCGTTTATRTAAWTSLPRPARDLIELEPYRQAWTQAHGYFSINMVASRGCPYRCNWCAKPISGDRFQVRPADAVAAEMFSLEADYGADHVWFGDDVFALDHRWADALAAALEQRRFVLPFKVQSRADLMTAPTVEALRRAGCAEVWMGVESGSQKILDAMDKGLQVTEVITARERLRSAGIRACYFLQFGYPGETWNDIQETISLVRATRPDDIGVSVSYPLPNTVFYEKVRAELGRKRNWTDSDDLCLMFRAAYSDGFYHALRDALHAEVSSWSSTQSSAVWTESASLWRRVRDLEPESRNSDATRISRKAASCDSGATQFVPLQQLAEVAREA